MSTLLLGDATETYTNATVTSSSWQEGWKVTALASGELTELRFRTNSVENLGCTSVWLGVYADAGDGPGALLASAEVDGQPATDSWIIATGLSATIIEGRPYWLAVHPRGYSVHYNTATASGGTPDYSVPNETDAMLADWGTTDPGDILAWGPLGFQGLGVADAPLRDSGLEWHITGLWHPGATHVDYYGRIADPSDDGVVVELDMQRTARVTLSTAEDVAQHVAPGLTYQRCLRAYYHGQLVYWAAINDRETDAAAGKITLASVDPSLRLQRHQLRRGDLLGTLTEANDDKGSVSVDHIGLRQLRDAGLNTTEQNLRGDPDLGIIDGTNNVPATPFNKIGVTRGDQVWNAMLQLSQSLGPDFELEPIENTVGAYCRMNTYVHQGQDVSALVALHWGCGNDNLENIRDLEGAKYTTHDHVLPRDIKNYRFTQANPQASAETGPYVDWDATDYDSEGIPADKVEDVLRAYGDDVLKAYSRPLQECVLTLPIEDATSYLYLRDYRVGDTISVAARRDLYELDSSFYRITAVRLNHDGADDTVRPELQVIADRVAELGDAVASAGTGDD